MFKPKHRRRVDSVYPTESNVNKPNTDSMQRLISYLNHRPIKIVKVSDYMEKRTRVDAQKNITSNLNIALYIIEEILKECDTVLNEFISRGLILLSIINTSTDITIQAHSARVFVLICSIIDENSLSVHYNDDNFEELIRDYERYSFQIYQNKTRESLERVEYLYEILKDVIGTKGRPGRGIIDFIVDSSLVLNLEERQPMEIIEITIKISEAIFSIAVLSGMALEGFNKDVKSTRLELMVYFIVMGLKEENFFESKKDAKPEVSVSLNRKVRADILCIFFHYMLNKAILIVYKKIMNLFIKKIVIEKEVERDLSFQLLKMLTDFSPSERLPSILNEFIYFLKEESVEPGKKVSICIYMQYVMNKNPRFPSFEITELTNEIITLLEREDTTQELFDSFSFLLTGIALCPAYWKYSYMVLVFIIQRFFLDSNSTPTNETAPMALKKEAYRKAIWDICIRIVKCITEENLQLDNSKRLNKIPSALLDGLLQLCLDSSQVYRKYSTRTLYICLKGCPPNTWKGERKGCMTTVENEYISQMRATMFLECLENNKNESYDNIFNVISIIANTGCSVSIYILVSALSKLLKRELNDKGYVQRSIMKILLDLCIKNELDEGLSYISEFCEWKSQDDGFIRKQTEDAEEEKAFIMKDTNDDFDIGIILKELIENENACPMHPKEKAVKQYVPQIDLEDNDSNTNLNDEDILSESMLSGLDGETVQKDIATECEPKQEKESLFQQILKQKIEKKRNKAKDLLEKDY
eukprot:GHVP01034555.1.p1 GENE.GHVP01034555.1~~GHVP01034555.1.p1  ORF type:complete len:757 (+),score=134.11 GHVP01034555.1:2853-5123(+)